MIVNALHLAPIRRARHFAHITTRLTSCLLAIGLGGLLSLVSLQQAGAQASITGVVNRYVEVTSVDFCNNLVAVISSSGYAVGDLVMIIQMKGSSIDSDDLPSFGQILNYNTTGQYEWLRIGDINANIITFQEAMLRDYDAAGAVQLIRIPEYTDVSIDGQITAQPWDGATGGVVAISASGMVTFNDDIDVAGMGFRGAQPLDFAGCENGGAGYDGYRCALADGCGGPKGEGIAVVPGAELGRGPLASGGGGGNDYNSGGGGGSNYGGGGDGGERRGEAGGDCLGDFPGLGAGAIAHALSQGRIYLGGGGGAGDSDDGEGSAGGNGGGIVVIQANQIIGNDFDIDVSGLKPATIAGLDGAGGGGAAGTVVLDVASYVGDVDVFAEGGEGGDVDNGNDPAFCFGPGGGGAGGALWVSAASVPPQVNLSDVGGEPGTTVNANAPAACAGSSNGAEVGLDGGNVTGAAIPQSTLLYEELSLSVLPTDTAICYGDTITLTAMGTGTGGVTFNWSDGQSGPVIQVSPTGPAIYNVTVTDVRDCSLVEQVTISVTEPVSVTIDPEGITSPGLQVQLSASDGFVSYLWTPSEGLSATNTQVTFANPLETTQYCVTAVDAGGCESEDCATVEKDLLITIPNAFTPDGDGLNDEFRMPDELPCEAILEFKVFDRWGEVVFNGGIDASGWDGTGPDGTPQLLGTYIYIVRLICSGQDKQIRGTVTLLR